VLLDTTMPDLPENREKLCQFVAQEIRRDGKIPHATYKATEAIIEEAKRRAKTTDEIDGLTLRLRELSGIIRLAGDSAVGEKAEHITEEHVKHAILRGKTIDEQLSEKYGSVWKAGMSETGLGREKKQNQKEVS